MHVDARVPVTLRADPIDAKGNYSVEVWGKSGAVLETFKTESAWNRMPVFKFSPKGEEEGPF